MKSVGENGPMTGSVGGQRGPAVLCRSGGRGERRQVAGAESIRGSEGDDARSTAVPGIKIPTCVRAAARWSLRCCERPRVGDRRRQRYRTSFPISETTWYTPTTIMQAADTQSQTRQALPVFNAGSVCR